MTWALVPRSCCLGSRQSLLMLSAFWFSSIEGSAPLLPKPPFATAGLTYSCLAPPNLRQPTSDPPSHLGRTSDSRAAEVRAHWLEPPFQILHKLQAEVWGHLNARRSDARRCARVALGAKFVLFILQRKLCEPNPGQRVLCVAVFTRFTNLNMLIRPCLDNPTPRVGPFFFSHGI